MKIEARTSVKLQEGQKIKVPYLWPPINGLKKASSLLAGRTVHFHNGKFVFGKITRIFLTQNDVTFRGIGFLFAKELVFEGGTASTEPALESVGSTLIRLSGTKVQGVVKLSFPENEGQVRDFLRILIRTDISLIQAAKETGVTAEEIPTESIKKVVDQMTFVS